MDKYPDQRTHHVQQSDQRQLQLQMHVKPTSALAVPSLTPLGDSARASLEVWFGMQGTLLFLGLLVLLWVPLIVFSSGNPTYRVSFHFPTTFVSSVVA